MIIAKMTAAFVVVASLSQGVCAEAVGKSTPAGFTDDFAAAKAEAAKTGRKIVAVFSGSDWCYWCKVLEKGYLSKRAFVDAAKKDFVLVFIDNPRDPSVLSEQAKRNNGALTRKYGIRGFPTVKVLAADGAELGEARPKDKASPAEYAAQLRRLAAQAAVDLREPVMVK